MTHLFEVSLNEMTQLVGNTKTFDILQFRRGVSTGDTILYQLEHLTDEEGEDAMPSDSKIPQEYAVTIDFLFDDSCGALKKGFTAVAFKEKE